MKKKLFQWLKTNILRHKLRYKNLDIVFYPKMLSVEVLYRELSRVVWYLSPFMRWINSITFYVDSSLKEISVDSIRVPEYADPCICDLYNKYRDKIKIEFVNEKHNIEIDRYDFLFDVSGEYKKSSLVPYVVNASVDENQFEANQMALLSRLFLPLKYNVVDESKSKFFAFSESIRQKNISSVVLMGSGPSLSDLEEVDFNISNSLIIVCNSVVNNDLIFTNYAPDIIVASDAVFHSGYSRYAADFRSKVMQRMTEHESLLFVVPLRDYFLYLNAFPVKIHDRVIAIPIEREKNYNYNLSSNFYFRSTSNVLTLMMLPLAKFFDKKTYLIGFDGKRMADKDIFWQYDKKSQFNDSYDSTRLAHPAFYKVNYDHYYKLHCDETELLIKSFGFTHQNLVSLMNSNIPILKNFYG